VNIFDYERPVGIQIYGGAEEILSHVTSKIVGRKPDIIDVILVARSKSRLQGMTGAGVLKM
jgi:hypothetical protein